MIGHRFAPLLLLLVAAAATSQTTPPPTPGWRAGRAAGVPAWFQIRASQRTRYEYLTDQFRAGAPGEDMGLSMLTLVAGEARFKPLFFGAEMQDSRLYLDDANAPLDTTLINTFELLQGYAGVDLRDVLMPGATGSLRGGRVTIDLGSRRLVARNAFRNTINAFTGADLLWASPAQDAVRVFAVLPVDRRPNDRARLDDNDTEFDDESSDSFLWAVFLASRPLTAGLRGELYVLGLQEQDSGDTATRDRELVTPGMRVFRAPARAAVDVELEGVAQTGTSRATARADDVTDLDHLAFFVHFGVGYTFDIPWTPRALLLYDYASGDRDPDDGDNERFDTLFGARRWELGPTGIFGAFARSNLNGPGLRTDLRPHSAVEANFQYRPFWLAENRDAWVAAGVRDPDGDSGNFIGNQIEGRLLWRVVPGNLTLELGFAHVWLGEFAETAPNANKTGDPTYFYTQFEVQI